MGDSWETTDNLAQLSPYYAWYKQAVTQMSLYGYAQHVGKINRGQFLNPELNMPKDRAFGYQSDFNPEDLKSGAFNNKPQGQKFRATEVKTVLILKGELYNILCRFMLTRVLPVMLEKYAPCLQVSMSRRMALSSYRQAARRRPPATQTLVLMSG